MYTGLGRGRWLLLAGVGWVVAEGGIQWEVGIAEVVEAGRRSAAERVGRVGSWTRSRPGQSATYGCGARRRLRRMRHRGLQRSGAVAAVGVAAAVLQSEGAEEQRSISKAEQSGLHQSVSTQKKTRS